MELKHNFTVPSSLADTWRSFNQPGDIAPCFPGATLTGVDGDTFTGTVKIKLGPIAMMYAGTGKFLSRDEASHTVVIEAQGKDKRGNGTAGATVTAVLSAEGAGTAVEVSTDMNVTGKPAQFGRGVIQDISDKLLEQFVQCMIKKAAGPDGEAPPGLEADGKLAGSGSGEAAAAGTVAAPDGPAADSAAPVAPTPAAASSEAAAGPPDASAASANGASSSAPGGRHLPPPVDSAAPELDLGSAVLPVLARRYGPAVLGALAVLGLVLLLCRRKKR